MATTVVEDIEIQQGATYRHIVEVWANSAKTLALAAVDITAARLQVREAFAELDAVAEVSIDDDALGGITVADGAETAEITFVLTAAQTQSIPYESGRYDLEAVFSDGDTERVMMGNVLNSLEVTR